MKHNKSKICYKPIHYNEMKLTEINEEESEIHYRKKEMD
jgi:hypothetical protein